MRKQIALSRSLYTDLLGFAFLGMSVFTALVLYSYSPSDPSFFYHTTSDIPVENIGGMMGAYLASLYYFILGSASFSIVFLYAYAAFLTFTNKSLKKEVERVFASIIIPLSLGSIFALHETDLILSSVSGGLIGFRLGSFVSYYIDNLGAVLFFYALLVSCVIVIGRFNYMKIVKRINSVGIFIVRQCKHKRIDKKTIYAVRFCYVMGARIVKWSFRQIRNTLNGSIFDSVKLFDPPKLDGFKTSLAEKQGPATLSHETAQVKIPTTTYVTKENGVDNEVNSFSDVHQESTQLSDTSDYTVPNQTFFDVQNDEYNGDADSKQRAITLEEKLERFGVKGKVVDIKYGPVVTLYEYQPESHVKLSKIVALEDDLSLALQAMSIRILAPIPGRSVVGFEVANKTRADVLFSNVIHSSAYQETKAALPLVLGADTCGEYVVEDLSRMPHLLVAGSTGSGKSVALNAMLMSLLCKHSPQTLRMILIDPKRLEFSSYADIGHLLFPIVTDPKQAIMSLKWAIKEMERRYEQMATHGVRNIFEFHKLNPENKKEFPFIVIVIDELADLMITVAKDIEEHITRLAQMARAAGIHLIVATQRPSVDVITGLIKVNFPSRISFRVTSKIDSRTIIDATGSEKLLGRGDMLFLNGVSSMIERIHGAYVTDVEIGKVTRYIRTSWPAVYEDIQELDPIDESLSMSHEDEMLLEEVHEYLQEVDEVSISLIQRKFRIGYNKSARIIELLEAQGYVMPAQGGKRRKVIR